MKVLQHAIKEGSEQNLYLFRYAGGTPPHDIDLQNRIHNTLEEDGIHGTLGWPEKADTKDYLNPGNEVIKNEVIKKAIVNAQKDGLILLSHDKHGSEVFPLMGLTWTELEK